MVALEILEFQHEINEVITFFNEFGIDENQSNGILIMVMNRSENGEPFSF